MAETKPVLVLIDGYSNLFKAYHAIREPLTNSAGEPTSAVYGFLNMFFRLGRQLDLSHVAVVFDAPGGSFRDELYKDYKANREAMPDDLRVQDRRVREALALLSVPVLEIPGYEADDVLACLAVRAVERGGEAFICSSDKDLLQVVRPGIKIWREHLQKTEIMDEEAVFAKLGVKPSQVAAYLGLIGDTSDNIPGVPGIGPKTASALLQEFGTVEAILAAAPGLKKKSVSEKLVAHAESARLSEHLATLRFECFEEEFSWDRFRWETKATPELREFYRAMNFRSFLTELGGDRVEDREVRYETICTRAGLEKAVAAIRKSGLAAIDTETNDLDTMSADLVGVSISWEKNQAIYIPVGHHCSDDQLTMDDLRAVLGPALADPAIRWVAHHWNFDYKMFVKSGFTPGPIHGDTMISSYLLNPERATPLRLKELAINILGIEMTEIDQLIGSGDDLVTMASVSIEDTSRYACQDADVTRQLHVELHPKLAEAGVEKLAQEVELPLIAVLAAMERDGVRIDGVYFRELSRQAEKELEEMTSEIYRIAGREFKINSPKQVAELLFEELNMPKSRKGKSGAYSTDVKVLESISHLHPLPAKLLEYRQVEKLKNTYLDPLPSMIHPKTGRVHTSYNQTVASTGRLSSSNPNLQNIPIRTEAGRRIRRGFLASDGWRLLAADYSQIELRILAHLSGDEALTNAFLSGVDIHTQTASKVFRIDQDQVTPTMRNQAKAINFGIVYGMSSFRLGNDLEIPQSTAKQFIEDYFRIYSGVAKFIESTKEAARRDGYVTTLLGRRRFVSDINSRNANARSFAERIAVNTPIQGTSADMIKLAMIRIADRLKKENLGTRMIMQVHDELVFDVPPGEIDSVTTLVREEMSSAIPLRVPMQVNISHGENWDEC